MKFYSLTRRRVFDNGMEAYFLPRPGCAIELDCYIRTGSAHEGEFLGCGVSHFLEHMLFQGCEGYPEQRAAEAVAALGGTINACTGQSCTMVNVGGPARHLEEFVRVVTAMVRTPTLPEAKFQLEKQVILRECDRSRDQVSSRLVEELLRTMFPIHPLRHPICGYPEMVAKCTCDMLRQYHAGRYTPERCFWVLTGAFSTDAATEILEKYCGSWERSSLYSPALPEDPEPRSPRSGEFVFPDPLARIAAAVRLPADDAALIDAAEVLFGVLGLGKSAKLVRSLQQRDRLAVNVSAGCFAACGKPLGVICASAKPAQLGKLEKQLFRELSLARSGKLDKRSIEREKRQRYVDLLRMTESPSSVAQNIGSAVLAGEPPAGCDHRIERIGGLRLEDLRRAADRLLDPEHLTVVRQLSRRCSGARKTAAAAPRRICRAGDNLLLARDAAAPIIHFALTLPGGSLFAARPGAASFCAAWLKTGPANRTEEEFWARIEDCGGELAINAGANSFGISFSAPRRSFGTVLKLVGELLGAPRFSDATFERERDRMIEIARSNAQDPVKSAVARAKAALFGRHPYGRTLDEKTLAALDPAEVRDFYRSILCRERICTAVSGNCSEAEALEYRDALFRSIPLNAAPPTLPAEPEFPAAPVRIDLDLPREQTAVILALPGCCMKSGPDLRTDLLCRCENGLTSRLFHRVREDNALAYSVGMTVTGGFHRGSCVFYALTNAAGAEKALELLREEVGRLGSSGVTEAEFLPAREAAAFDAERLLDVGSALAETAALDLYYGIGPEAIVRRGEKLREIGLGDFNAFLGGLFSDALDHGVTAISHGTAAD